jgi:enamine deaminase RidA (YjgF/YER057c/UK114 family)
MSSLGAGGVPEAEARLHQLGLTLTLAPQRAGNFLNCVQAGGLLFVSGQGSHDHRGTVGADLDLEAGYEAARECALRLLGLVKEELGSLDRVQRVVKVLGFVHCVPEFDRTPLVLNGASDLLIEVYGEAGRHARSAIGVPALPRNFAVEAEMIVQVAQ